MTWEKMLELHPPLAEVDDKLSKLKQAQGRFDGPDWPRYEAVRQLVNKHVGANAPKGTPKAITTSEAYEVALRHACDVLEI